MAGKVHVAYLGGSSPAGDVVEPTSGNSSHGASAASSSAQSFTQGAPWYAFCCDVATELCHRARDKGLGDIVSPVNLSTVKSVFPAMLGEGSDIWLFVLPAAKYDPTKADLSGFLSELFDGASSAGLSKNVQDAMEKRRHGPLSGMYVAVYGCLWSGPLSASESCATAGGALPRAVSSSEAPKGVGSALQIPTLSSSDGEGSVDMAPEGVVDHAARSRGSSSAGAVRSDSRQNGFCLARLVEWRLWELGAALFVDSNRNHQPSRVVRRSHRVEKLLRAGAARDAPSSSVLSAASDVVAESQRLQLLTSLEIEDLDAWAKATALWSEVQRCVRLVARRPSRCEAVSLSKQIDGSVGEPRGESLNGAGVLGGIGPRSGESKMAAEGARASLLAILDARERDMAENDKQAQQLGVGALRKASRQERNLGQGSHARMLEMDAFHVARQKGILPPMKPARLKRSGPSTRDDPRVWASFEEPGIFPQVALPGVVEDGVVHPASRAAGGRPNVSAAGPSTCEVSDRSASAAVLIGRSSDVDAAADDVLREADASTAAAVAAGPSDEVWEANRKRATPAEDSQSAHGSEVALLDRPSTSSSDECIVWAEPRATGGRLTAAEAAHVFARKVLMLPVLHLSLILPLLAIILLFEVALFPGTTSAHEANRNRHWWRHLVQPGLTCAEGQVTLLVNTAYDWELSSDRETMIWWLCRVAVPVAICMNIVPYVFSFVEAELLGISPKEEDEWILTAFNFWLCSLVAAVVCGPPFLAAARYQAGDPSWRDDTFSVATFRAFMARPTPRRVVASTAAATAARASDPLGRGYEETSTEGVGTAETRGVIPVGGGQHGDGRAAAPISSGIQNVAKPRLAVSAAFAAAVRRRLTQMVAGLMGLVTLAVGVGFMSIFSWSIHGASVSNDDAPSMAAESPRESTDDESIPSSLGDVGIAVGRLVILLLFRKAIAAVLHLGFGVSSKSLPEKPGTDLGAGVAETAHSTSSVSRVDEGARSTTSSGALGELDERDRALGDRNHWDLLSARCAHYLPCGVAMWNGVFSAFYLLQTSRMWELQLFLLVDWVIFFLRLWSVSYATPRGRNLQKAALPQALLADEPASAECCWWRSKLYAFLVCGRLRPPSYMAKQEFYAWIVIIESTMQTSVFGALLLAYPLVFSTPLGVGTGGIVQRMVFPFESASARSLLVAGVSDAIQDGIGHWVLTRWLNCHYTRHFAGSWVGLIRITLAALSSGMLPIISLIIVGRIAETAGAGNFG